MIYPFSPEETFILNDKLEPRLEGEVIIIDNIFKNFDHISNLCQNFPVEKWKDSDNSRNFKDYYDCRLTIHNYFPNMGLIKNRINPLIQFMVDGFGIDPRKVGAAKEFIFNYYKHLKKDLDVNIQQHPHFDEYYNVIFYIDEFENGGTALYEDYDIINKEEENLLFDISDLKIKKII